MNGIHGLQRHVFSSFAWESAINAAVNAAITGGATVDAIDWAFQRYINDQSARGLAYIGFNQVLRERIAEMQRQAREQAANPPESEPTLPEPADERITPPGMTVSSALVYGRLMWTVTLVDVADSRRTAATSDEAWELGRQMQAEWLAAEEAKRDQAATADHLRAVDGMTGVYRYALADGTPRFAAKWPGANASGTKTKRGFDSPEAAHEYRIAQTSKEPIAA